MDDSSGAGPDFQLTCWYINKRRLLERLGVEVISSTLQFAAGFDGHLRELAELTAFTDAASGWLRSQHLPTLGRILLAGAPAVGTVFTHYSNWWCKGVRTSWEAWKQGKQVVPALAYSKLDDLRNDWRVECRFHPEHLTSDSSRTELSGQKPLFVMALITGVSGTTIEAIPYIIGNPAISWDRPASLVGRRWQTKLECFVDTIDSFSAVSSVEIARRPQELVLLKSVSEKEVKEAIAEIIGEPIVPADWGGESSDLFSSRVVLDGRRVSSAFLLKGPAKFKPMTMVELGKNGDQISRLFSEPADLLVIQHCHEITSGVRATMRAFAQQIGQLRLFCIIDGYDTVRLLKAYNKCGFSATSDRVVLPPHRDRPVANFGAE